MPAAPAAPALDGKAIDALSARVGKIEQALAKLPAGDPATAERLAAAENAMKALGVTLAALNRRVDDIDGNAKQALAHADEAEKAVAALQTASKAAANAPAPALRDDIEALDKRIAALEQAAQAARAHIAENSGIDKAARLALSAAVLRDAVVQGLSFTAELAAVKSLGAGDKTLTALAPFAAAGVPGDKALAHELGALIPAMLKAAGAPAPPGVSSAGCRPMPTSSCASARWARRPATIRPTSSPASKSTRRTRIFPPRSPISPSRPTQRALRPPPGSRK